MSEYRVKINALQSKINQLREKELVLVKKRKTFLGDLGEQFDLLIFSDECLAGLLNECSEILSSSPQRVIDYEQKGKILFSKKQKCTTPKTHSKPISQSASIERSANGI